MLTAANIYARAAEVLEDVDYVTYLAASLIEWVNDAQRAVCMLRPDAKVAVESIELTADTSLQSLPTGSRRLGGLLANMGADGVTAGNAITGPVPRETLDMVLPGWRTQTGAAVRQYIYDDDTPERFWIWPHLTSVWYVEAKLFKTPTDLAAADDEIDIGDIYGQALIEWLLYRNFSRDSERTPNWTRAGRHLNTFFNLLGVKTTADLSVSPKALEYAK